jgi:hypothetical protein
LIVYLSLSASASEQVKKLFLALMLIPPVIYIFVGIGVCFIVCRRQTTHDLEDAKNAHKYLQAKRNLAKIVVTSGEKQPITGRFATFLHASRTNNTANLRWCLDDGQDPDEQDHVSHSLSYLMGSVTYTWLVRTYGFTLGCHDWI